MLCIVLSKVLLFSFIVLQVVNWNNDKPMKDCLYVNDNVLSTNRRSFFQDLANRAFSLAHMGLRLRWEYIGQR